MGLFCAYDNQRAAQALLILTRIVRHPQQLFGEIWGGEEMLITHRSWKAQAHLGPPNEVVDRGRECGLGVLLLLWMKIRDSSSRFTV